MIAMLYDTKFRTKSELYQWIKENPNGYHRTLKPYAIFNEVKNMYTGTKNIGENFWLYCNDHSKPLTCACGAKLLFENVINGYKSKECKPCYNKSRKENGLIGTTIKTQSTQSLPKCNNDTCTNPVVLKKDGTWSNYCSRECRGQYNSKKSRNKAKETMMRNHGVEHALRSDIIYNRMIEGNLNKFGTKNVMSNVLISCRPVETKLRKYGHPSSWSLPYDYQQHVDKSASKFGYSPGTFTNVSQIPGVHQKKLKSGYQSKDYILPSGKLIKVQGYENRFLDIFINIFGEDGIDYQPDTIIYDFNGKTHHYIPDFRIINYIVGVKSDYTFYKDFSMNMAKSLGVVNDNKGMLFTVICNNTNNFLLNDRSMIYLKGVLTEKNIRFDEYFKLNDYIVDLMLPDHNIALVYRPLWFTHNKVYAENYFCDMYKHFENNGIQLIVVNEHGITDVFVKSFTSKLQKSNNVIYARNTQVKEVSSGVYDFLNKNHIQGYSATSIKYGLYENGSLVALMCFNKPRKGIGKDRGPDAYELVRYATSKTVIGGASKLLKHFANKHGARLIYSYSDNSISNGNLYKKLGFTLESKLNSDYKYFKLGEYKLYHRFGYRKGALKDKLPYYDESKSEKELMEINDYLRFYDSGKQTWVMKYEK